MPAKGEGAGRELNMLGEPGLLVVCLPKVKTGGGELVAFGGSVTGASDVSSGRPFKVGMADPLGFLEIVVG